jgi:homoserine O-succinyltransferase/O-acetyltransferase
MPLMIDGGRIPSRWAERVPRSIVPIDGHVRAKSGTTIALINNMPDSALEDTELQFFEILEAASGNEPVFIRLYSLPGVPRSDRGQGYLNAFYHPFDELWNNQFDGIIVTGTEPHHPSLRDEPYWVLMTQLLEWAQTNTTSTILSCLAAHASVLHCDGINRHPLPDKKFGVFDATRSSTHILTDKTADGVRFPHSRWNEVREDELISAGYVVVTKSAEAGVDLFIKQMKRSLFVHFQGHPEYGAQSLAKEYRRDIRRFLRHERETYPTMPHGYFDEDATRLLLDFRAKALAGREEKLMDVFPEAVIETPLSTWRSTAESIYRNWLMYLASKRANSQYSIRPSYRDNPGQRLVAG